MRIGPGGIEHDDDEEIAAPPPEEEEEEEPPPPPQPERAWRTTPPELLAVSLRWEKLRVLGDMEPPKLYIREEKVHIDLDKWGLEKLSAIEAGGPITEHYRPADISDCLGTKSPQALLRDLFRPVKKYGVTDHDFIVTGYTPGDMAKESIEIGVAGRLKIASTLPPPLEASVALVEEQTRRRAFVASEWKIPPKKVYDGPEASPYDEWGLLKSLGNV